MRPHLPRFLSSLILRFLPLDGSFSVGSLVGGLALICFPLQSISTDFCHFFSRNEAIIKVTGQDSSDEALLEMAELGFERNLSRSPTLFIYFVYLLCAYMEQLLWARHHPMVKRNIAEPEEALAITDSPLV